MSLQIERVVSDAGAVAVTDNISTTGSVPFGTASGGMIFVESASAGTDFTVQFWATHNREGSYYRVYDSNNSAVDRSVRQGRCYAIPDQLFGAWGVKVVAGAGQTATLRVSLKG